MDLEKTNIDELTSDRHKFNDFLYTRLSTALKELKSREHDERIGSYLATLPNGIPEQMKQGKFAVLFRNVVTPNHELRRFVSIVEATGLTPLVIEYHEDKFLNRNECKFALGKICFHTGQSKDGNLFFEFKKIIDINAANMQKISTVQTHWGQRLVDFHHEFLQKEYLDKVPVKLEHFDASDWVISAGQDPKMYYKAFLSLFLKNAILFENFMLDEHEMKFTKEVILPTFIDICKETGHRPLIVALEPTVVEGDSFWLAHPGTTKKFLDEKMNPPKE